MRKLVIGTILTVIIASAAICVLLYNRILASNVNVSDDAAYLYIPTGSDFEDVMSLLQRTGVLRDTATFRWVALKKNYPRHIYPGCYRIPSGAGNNKLVDLLRSGKQEPVRLVFNNIRTPERLAGVISSQIEADSAGILSLFRDEEYLEGYGLTRETVIGIFIPNTYEIYWNTLPGDFFERMIREYRNFWDEERRALARRIGLEPMEVMTLASIVDEECLITEEEPRIAGVFMNRLERGIRLHADPTVKYAVGDMSITRVLNKHLEVDSPYNTYRYGGLPPGPIAIPSISSVEAVLNHEEHGYLYFCAREDLSGYHNFASTPAQHNLNARKYHRALDERRILR